MADAEAGDAGAVDGGHRRRVALVRRTQPEDAGLERGVLDQRLERGAARGTEVVVLVGEMAATCALAVHDATSSHDLDPESRLGTTLRMEEARVNGAQPSTCGRG